MNQLFEYSCGICYKFQIMVMSCDFSAHIYGNNQSALAKYTRPHLALKKNSSLISYRFLQEVFAKDELITRYIYTHDNVNDLLTKPMYNGIKQVKFINMILHHIM